MLLEWRKQELLSKYTTCAMSHMVSSTTQLGEWGCLSKMQVVLGSNAFSAIYLCSSSCQGILSSKFHRVTIFAHLAGSRHRGSKTATTTKITKNIFKKNWCILQAGPKLWRPQPALENHCALLGTGENRNCCPNIQLVQWVTWCQILHDLRIMQVVLGNTRN